MELEQNRQPGQCQWTEVVQIPVGGIGHADGRETRCDQRPLCLLRAVDEQIDVAEWSQRRARVPRRDLESLHQDERSVVGGARPLQCDLRGERDRSGETFVRGEILRDG